MSATGLRILLAEDDELFRLGLRMRLQQEPGFIIGAEAEDGETAIACVKQQPIDIVLLDVGLPGIGGIEACRQIKQQRHDLPVLALTSRTEPALISRLVEAGAQGYCLKGIAPETLMLAIRSVVAGASWWDATATTAIRAAFDPATLPPTGQPLTEPLTPREQEILTLIASGKSNQAIAETLYITPGTVRVHVHSILQKLKVADRTQAAVFAIQNKLIASD